MYSKDNLSFMRHGISRNLLLLAVLPSLCCSSSKRIISSSLRAGMATDVPAFLLACSNCLIFCTAGMDSCGFWRNCQGEVAACTASSNTVAACDFS